MDKIEIVSVGFASVEATYYVNYLSVIAFRQAFKIAFETIKKYRFIYPKYFPFGKQRYAKDFLKKFFEEYADQKFKEQLKKIQSDERDRRIKEEKRKQTEAAQKYKEQMEDEEKAKTKDGEEAKVEEEKKAKGEDEEKANTKYAEDAKGEDIEEAKGEDEAKAKMEDEEKAKKQKEGDANKNAGEVATKKEQKEGTRKREEQRKQRVAGKFNTTAAKEKMNEADKYIALFEKALEKAVEAISESVAKDYKTHENDENYTHAALKAASAIAEFVVEEVIEEITKVSFEATKLFYKARFATNGFEDVTFKDLSGFSDLMHFSYPFECFRRKFENTSRQYEILQQVLTEMEQKVKDFKSWLEKHQNDSVELHEKYVSGKCCIIMEYCMQPFIAGMGNLLRLTECLSETSGDETTSVQFVSFIQNLLKVIYAFESLEKNMEYKKGTDKTLPFFVNVKKWKEELEKISVDMYSYPLGI